MEIWGATVSEKDEEDEDTMATGVGPQLLLPLAAAGGCCYGSVQNLERRTSRVLGVVVLLWWGRAYSVLGFWVRLWVLYLQF